MAPIPVFLLFAALLPGILQAQDRFDDVAASAGVSMTHDGMAVDSIDTFGSGAAWLDIDNDGDLDLYVTMRQSANYLFENQGDGTFTEVGALWGAQDAGHDGSGVAAADFNNDGWVDLYLANADEDVLLKNDRGLGFVDVTATAFPGISYDARGQSASWGDYDGDGFLDLYVSNHKHLSGLSADHQDRVFHNNGDETFTEVSDLFGLSELDGYGFLGKWTDYDDDGDPDLFLVNDCIQGQDPDALTNRMFRNDGGIDGLDWRFTEVSVEVGIDQCENGMGLTTADYNRDGWFDYFMSNNYEPLLYKNLGGAFEDAATEAGVDERDVPGTSNHRQTWGVNFVDFNLDGWADLFVAAGSLHPPVEENEQPNILYTNNGDGTFTDISDVSGLADVNRGRTSIHADYDQDGDADLFLVNYGGNAMLYRNNNANGNHWLIVDLEGTVSNRNGIGAKVTVTTPDSVVQINELGSGSSLGGGDDLAVYFGLEANLAVDELQVRWPSGIVQTLTGVTVDQRLKVIEKGVLVKSVPDVWPVEIPAEGGVFVYTVTIENLTSLTQELDIWTQILGPGGLTLTKGPVPQTMTSGQTLTLVVTQNVPGGAPKGDYSVAASVGSFPVVDQEDVFFFTKAAPLASGARSVDDWRAVWRNFETDAVWRAGQTNAHPEDEVRVALTGASARALPGAFALSQNYPNPFNPTTSIAYEVPTPGRATVAVYNVLGQQIRTLAQGPHEAGSYRVTWDGRDASGTPVASGVYLYRMTAGAFVQTRAMMLLK